MYFVFIVNNSVENSSHYQKWKEAGTEDSMSLHCQVQEIKSCNFLENKPSWKGTTHPEG